MDYFKLFYNGGIQDVCCTLVDGFILKFGNSTNFSIPVNSLCQSASCMNISILNGSQLNFVSVFTLVSFWGQSWLIFGRISRKLHKYFSSLHGLTLEGDNVFLWVIWIWVLKHRFNTIYSSFIAWVTRVLLVIVVDGIWKGNRVRQLRSTLIFSRLHQSGH